MFPFLTKYIEGEFMLLLLSCKSKFHYNLFKGKENLLITQKKISLCINVVIKTNTVKRKWIRDQN